MAADAGAAVAATAQAPETARTVGRGFLFILTAKVYFLLTGFAVQFGLPRLLVRSARAMAAAGAAGLQGIESLATALYGEYGVAVRTVSWINNTMVQGTIQAVSRHVAEDERRAEAVRAAALRVQAFVGLTLALLYFALADLLATFSGNAARSGYFRVTAIIILAYALYAVLIGYLNGRKLFSAQAAFDIGFSTIKTCSILGLAFLGYGLHAILGAFSASAVIICLVAMLLVGLRNHTAETFPWRRLLGSMAAIVAYFILFNALLAADYWVLAGLAGRVAGASAAQASELIGIYNGVLNVALLPYQGVLAVAFVVFPLISRSTFDQDQETTRRYIESTLRYALVFAGGIAVAIAAMGEGLLGLLKADFVAGAAALRVYAAGEVFFALFAIANTMIIASGRTRAAMALAAATLLADFAGNLLLVRPFLFLAGDALDRGALLAAAGVTASVFALGFGAAALYLRRAFGARLPLLTLLRVAVVGGALVCGGALLGRPHPLLTLAGVGAAGLAYLGGLLLLRELCGEDIQRVLAVVQRRRAR